MNKLSNIDCKVGNTVKVLHNIGWTKGQIVEVDHLVCSYSFIFDSCIITLSLMVSI